MNKIEVFNETEKNIKEQELLLPLLEFAIEKEQLHDLEFSIILVDNQQIHELNRQYRGIDRPTDVITFALEDNEFEVAMPDEFGRVLGDIYISLEKAEAQAKEYGHSFKRELCFLTIHGFLHLLGYDHQTKEEEQIMFQKQEDILNGYGITK